LNPTSAVDVRSFINGRPMSRYQWLVLVLCFLIVAADGTDVAIMGFIAPPILQEWGISRAAFGVVMSAAPIGLVFGALFAGPASDKIGRKKVLVASVLAFGIFTLLASYARDTTEMAVLRFLTGIGLGAAMPNATTLLSEYVPERSRSLMVTLMFTGFNLGSALVGFVAAWLIPVHGWRSVLVAGGVLPLALVPLLLLLLPESSRYLAVRGVAAERIARTLGRVCGASFSAGTTFVSQEPAVPARTPVGLLFSRGFGAMSVALWVTYFMGLMVIYLLTGWLPTLFKDAGLSVSQAANITAMFQIGGTLGGVLVGWLPGVCRRCGQRAAPGHWGHCLGQPGDRRGAGRLLHERRADRPERACPDLLSDLCPRHWRELDARDGSLRQHPGFHDRRHPARHGLGLLDHSFTAGHPGGAGRVRRAAQPPSSMSLQPRFAMHMHRELATHAPTKDS